MYENDIHKVIQGDFFSPFRPRWIKTVFRLHFQRIFSAPVLVFFTLKVEESRGKFKLAKFCFIVGELEIYSAEFF